jgi:DNA-binding NtrC family response regulator
MAESSTITSRDLGLVENSRESDPMPFSEYMGLPLSEAKATLVDKFERAAIAHALDAAGGNISAAARQLGMHRQSLQQKMKQLELNAGSEE